MNKKHALLASKIAWVTYLGGQNIDSFTLTARFENKGTDTQGIFGTADDHAVIAFRGSEETGIADWITDLKFYPADYPFGGPDGQKVHAGFLEAYQSVREVIITHAKEASQKKLMIAGHSLGGALACFAALDIVRAVPDKAVTVYTFGCPKPGNPTFAAHYNQRVPNTYRIVNHPDVVPNLPPDIPFVIDYEHVGQLRTVGEEEEAQGVVDTAQAHLPPRYTMALA